MTLGRSEARISQRGASSDRIDWLDRIHDLQWTGNKSIDPSFAVVGFVRRFRRLR